MEHGTYGLGYAAESSGVADARIFRATSRSRILFSTLQLCLFYVYLWKLAIVLAVASSGRRGPGPWVSVNVGPLCFALGVNSC